jgi:hypothetical protein
MRSMMLLLTLLGAPLEAHAFCGFYAGRANGDLYNQASRVVLARNGNNTVITMANDYQGDLREFAMIVPVPSVIGEGDVKVLESALIDAVDDYSAPRLAEYHDADPCAPEYDLYLEDASAVTMTGIPMRAKREASRDLGVRVEAKYSVEEYDVLVLSAQESSGLETWLRREGYRLPDGASEVLASYIRQDLRFFVAKVDARRLARNGFSELRPLQVRYSSPRFTLPIRLGTVNADGPQDLLLFTVTPHGRVETANYRTVPIPTDMPLPPSIKDDFGSFYLATFERFLERQGGSVVAQEYAWLLSVFCDPCSADPLTVNQLQLLGADWVQGGGKLPNAAFLTRLHARYTAESFPADLRLHETRDNRTAQGRYVIHHPWEGPATCEAGETYRRDLADRQRLEAANLAHLTGWRSPTPRPAGGGGSWIPEVGGLQFWDWTFDVQ